jgi:arylsulfatase A-like enzyme
MKPKNPMLLYGSIIIPEYIEIKNDEDNKHDEITNQHKFVWSTLALCITSIIITSIIILSISVLKNTDDTIRNSIIAFLTYGTTNVISDKGQMTNTKPNIIIILADDLSWNSIGYTSNDMEVITPYLTNLAKNGIIMNNFYAQEVCTPSRASLLTGRYPLSMGMQYGMIMANAEWGMPLDEITLAEVLKENSYSTHMLGKWHLGYFSPLFLPTSRGFDSWTGYSNGETYYWSKKSPDYPKHNDLLQSNTSCYTPYNEEDKHDYSTTFYTNKAINIIKNHNSNDNIPLFLYLAYQSVHDPFDDYGNYEKGIPDSYFDDNLSILTTIRKNIVGKIRQEYVKSLYLLDKGVGQIYDTLNDKGILDNTYIIFMSDNGGCWYGGGRNGPLRGSKGSLFEGGIKVTSFIYGSNLKQKGITYDGLMHISDWFPTILALANIDYTPDDDFSLDGVNQIDGWSGKSIPRTSMLYNMYIKLTDYNFNIWTNGSFAVRDDKYKLMHTYDDHSYGAWFDIDTEVLDDDELDSGDRCAQQFVTGSFTYWLFDLVNDPYETTNIYSSTNQLHTLAKEKLYTLIPRYMEKAKQKISISLSSKAEVVWKEADNNIVPWANIENLQNADDNYPILCL